MFCKSRYLLLLLGIVLAIFQLWVNTSPIPQARAAEIEHEREEHNGEKENEYGEESPEEIQFEQAKEEASLVALPPNTFSLPVGEVIITPNELLAGKADQTIAVKLTLQRPVNAGVLRIRVPSRWVLTPASGIPTTQKPRLRDEEATSRNTLQTDQQTFRVIVRNGSPGDVIETVFTDNGIPAGTQKIELGWRDEQHRTETLYDSGVVLYAPVREPLNEEEKNSEQQAFRLPSAGSELNASNDNVEHPEPAIAVTEGNPDRIAAAANSIGGSSTLFLSTDGGKSWNPKTLAATLDAPGQSLLESGSPSGDPMIAADRNGNIWYGELTVDNGPGNPSRITVNRLDANSNSFQPVSVGLPVRTNGQQDKNAMTIDNSPTSPTYGRLYVVWSEPSPYGGVNVVITHCDSQPSPAACDNADNWSYPVAVTADEGSYIYASVATGPDGKVYVTWWDYSNMNAIRGATCSAGTANCELASAWTTTTIALLNAQNNSPLPFACPILAQPGGRAAPAPQVSVDHSNTASRGLVYVTWGDLRSGSGTTRCLGSVSPRDSHLSWDTFLAVARNQLPSSNTPSASAGTLLSNDSSAAGSNSDDWFSSVAVDQTNGDAWATFYATRTDAQRKTANYFIRRIETSSGTPTLGALIQASTAPSDYSWTQCCGFGNDYGDYAGLAATGGFALPAWTAKRGSTPGQVYVSVFDARTTAINKPASTSTTTTPEPTNRAKPLTIALRLKNNRIAVNARGQIRLQLNPPSENAQGVLKLTYPIKSGKRKLKATTLARVKFQVKAGKQKTIVFRLSASGRKLLAKTKRLRAQLTIALRSTNQSTQKTLKVTVYRR